MIPTPQQLIEDVAERYGVTPDDILSKKRTQTVADARALVCYFLLKHLHMSSTEVGNAINRNHATALHSIQKVDMMLDLPSMYPECAHVYVEVCNKWFSMEEAV